MRLCAVLQGEKGRGELGDSAPLCRQTEKEHKPRCGEQAGSFREEEELESAVRKSHQAQSLAPRPCQADGLGGFPTEEVRNMDARGRSGCAHSHFLHP